jgi:hypothetical protein
MSASATHELAAIRDRLASLRGRERRLRAGAGLCALVAHAVAATAVFAVLDLAAFSHFDDPGADRLIRAAALAGVLAWLGWIAWNRIVVPWRSAGDEEDLALRIEAAHPNLQGRLISALQLSRPGDRLAAGASPVLLANLMRETATMAAPIDFFGILDRREVYRLCLIAGGCLAVAAGLGAWRIEESGVVLRRLLLAQAQYPAQVRFLSLTGDLAVAHGGSAEIVAEVDPARTVPDAVTLIVRPAGGRAEVRQSLGRGGRPGAHGGVCFAGRIEPVVEDLEFRAAALDARWPTWSRIRVISPPAVLGVACEIAAPAYAQRPPRRQEGGDIEALAGSRVTATLRVTKPLGAGPHLVLQLAGSGERRLPLAPAADGLSAAAAFSVDADGSWWPSFADRDGLRPIDPPRWRLRALPDAPPSVELLEPDGDQLSSPAAAWPVGLRAADDIGISGAAIAWTVSDAKPGEGAAPSGAEGRRPIPGLAPAALAGGGVELAGRARFDLAPLGLRPGQRVTWWIEVADNRAPQPQVARSASRVFTIATAAQVQEALHRDRADLLHRLGQLRDRQEEAKASLDRMRRELRGGKP